MFTITNNNNTMYTLYNLWYFTEYMGKSRIEAALCVTLSRLELKMLIDKS